MVLLEHLVRDFTQITCEQIWRSFRLLDLGSFHCAVSQTVYHAVHHSVGFTNSDRMLDRLYHIQNHLLRTFSPMRCFYTPVLEAGPSNLLL